MSQGIYALRRDKVAHAVQKERADGILVTRLANVRYLTGFTGEDTFLLLGKKRFVLVSDDRYLLQIQRECTDEGTELFSRPVGMSLSEALAHVLQRLGWKTVLFEADCMSVELHSRLSAAVSGVTLVPSSRLVERFRQIKDETEIGHIRAAIRVAEQAMEIIRSLWTTRQTEKEIQSELEYFMRRLGADGVAFTPIVAAGPQAALPHARSSSQTVDEAPCLLVDWGAKYEGYCCDLTRVFLRRKVPGKLRRMYEVVLEAQHTAISLIRPGVSAREVDEAARGVIAKARLGKYFNHGLGHGLGLEVHENPRLTRNSEDILQPGMVVTVEPGVYIPDFAGVRIEDDVLVTPEGHEILTHFPKDIDQMVIWE